MKTRTYGTKAISADMTKVVMNLIYQGMTKARIAEVTGLPESTVRYIVAQAS